MAELTLYSTGCPKCKVIETKLKQKNITFNVVTDTDSVIKVSQAQGIDSIPILQVDSEYFNFRDAVNYINGR